MFLHSTKDAVAACNRWISNDAICLDTETTGLGNNAQIIEIAITDLNKNILFNQRIKPTTDIEHGALSVHGITPESLINCPSWPDIADEIKRITTDRDVIIFNTEFDYRLMQQTARAFNSDTAWIDENIRYNCAMKCAALVYGATNRYGTISLANATARAGVIWEGDAHSAAADALATAALVHKMAIHS